MTAADRLHALTTSARELQELADRLETTLRPGNTNNNNHPSAATPELQAGPGSTPIQTGVNNKIARLQTLAQVQAVPRAKRKDQLGTTLDRAIANKAARLLDAKQLRDWARKVKDRDQWKDRKTGLKVRSTRSLDPLRAEAHHIESRSNKTTRTDVRNGVTLSYANHVAVTTNVYRIEGTVFFRGSDGGRYINGNFPVTFVKL